MNKLLKAAKAVIAATDTAGRWCAIAKLHAAVYWAEQEPEPEPVGYLFDIDRYCDHRPERNCLAKTINPNIPKDKLKNVRPVYAHPPRQPVRLSDEEIDMLWTIHDTDIDSFARAVEDKVLEKNQ